MLDKFNSNRPERRSPIIFKKLKKYDIDIAALSEGKFFESGCIKEDTVYTFIWSGKTSTDWSESALAFAVRNGLLLSMSEDPKPVSDRIITLRFPLFHSRYCTLMTTNVPTMTDSLEKIISFYDQLDQIFRAILNKDKIVLLRDFKARVVSYIIPGRRVLKWRKLISMKICCYLSAQNTIWSLPTPTSNPTKSTRTLGCIQVPNTSTLLPISSRDSVICLNFWTQERLEESTAVVTMLWSSPFWNK